MVVTKYRVCPFDGRDKRLGDNRDDTDYNDCIGCSGYNHCNIVKAGKEARQKQDQMYSLAMWTHTDMYLFEEYDENGMPIDC